jgi:hypothetical protein
VPELKETIDVGASKGGGSPFFLYPFFAAAVPYVLCYELYVVGLVISDQSLRVHLLASSDV